MVATKQTYSITPTWTAAQLASIFENSFIDAGLMSAWHDSFLSGSIENRILKVEYDNTKTYGSTYYWFMFSTSGAFLHVATGWNTTTKVPTGTQYLDYFATTTNSTGYHWNFFAISTSNSVELVRYTSGIDTSQTWFVLKSSATRFEFCITSGESELQPWIDLSKGIFTGFHHVTCLASSHYGRITFHRGPGVRRDLISGAALNGNTDHTNYSRWIATISGMGYASIGNGVDSAGSLVINGRSSLDGFICLPANFSGTNPAFTSNSNPVFHSMPYSPHLVAPMPSDFGITFHYATNTFSPGDTFVVQAGVEEWEALDYAESPNAITGASPLFLARMI